MFADSKSAGSLRYVQSVRDGAVSTAKTMCDVGVAKTRAEPGVRRPVIGAVHRGSVDIARRIYIREVKDEVMFQCCFGLDFR